MRMKVINVAVPMLIGVVPDRFRPLARGMWRVVQLAVKAAEDGKLTHSEKDALAASFRVTLDEIPQ